MFGLTKQTELPQAEASALLYLTAPVPAQAEPSPEAPRLLTTPEEAEGVRAQMMAEIHAAALAGNLPAVQQLQGQYEATGVLIVALTVQAAKALHAQLQTALDAQDARATAAFAESGRLAQERDTTMGGSIRLDEPPIFAQARTARATALGLCLGCSGYASSWEKSKGFFVRQRGV